MLPRSKQPEAPALVAQRGRGDAVKLPQEPLVQNYLNRDYSVRSWLFTRDHKRIAILYLLSITAFFFIGGVAASLFRIELIHPHGALVTDATYNKLFTIHGIVMVWFFL